MTQINPQIYPKRRILKNPTIYDSKLCTQPGKTELDFLKGTPDKNRKNSCFCLNIYNKQK